MAKVDVVYGIKPALLPKQLAMRTCANEYDRPTFSRAVVDAVDQEKVSADVALAVAGPFALEGVILPFRIEGRVVGDQHEHDRL